MVILCRNCEKSRAIIKRPKNGHAVCKECFFTCFEEEVHQTIVKSNIFKRGDRVAIASSGGKDSTVLGYIMALLNKRHDYGLDLILLSIDEGITGYRDDSLEAVKSNQEELNLPLTILNYKDLYNWTMDEIVQKVGYKSNCTFCGVFRRQALDRGALQLDCNMIVTGHNADDLAETILMNILRGDIARLKRSVNISTGKNDQSDSCENPCAESECCGESCNEKKKKTLGSIPRSKPFKYTYEKEIVMYAYFKKLLYFSTECIYAPNSYRGHARAFLKDLESIRPSAILDIIHSGESIQVRENLVLPTQGTCIRCGYISSQNICKACVMLEGLNKGMPKLGIGKSSKVQLIKDVNQKVNNQRVCRKKDCSCELEHRKSAKQVKKEKEIANVLAASDQMSQLSM